MPKKALKDQKISVRIWSQLSPGTSRVDSRAMNAAAQKALMDWKNLFAVSFVTSPCWRFAMPFDSPQSQGSQNTTTRTSKRIRSVHLRRPVACVHRHEHEADLHGGAVTAVSLPSQGSALLFFHELFFLLSSSKELTIIFATAIWSLH